MAFYGRGTRGRCGHFTTLLEVGDAEVEHFARAAVRLELQAEPRDIDGGPVFLKASFGASFGT